MIRSVLKTLYWNQWLALALFFVIGGFMRNWVLDIAVHDTYYVIGGHTIGLLAGGFFLISWCLFRFFPAFRSLRWLARIHLTGTTITTILIFMVLSNVNQKPRRYSDYSVYTEFNQEQPFYADWISVLLFTFLLLQLIWIVQLIVWYYYKARGPKG